MVTFTRNAFYEIVTWFFYKRYFHERSSFNSLILLVQKMDTIFIVIGAVLVMVALI